MYSRPPGDEFFSAFVCLKTFYFAFILKRFISPQVLNSRLIIFSVNTLKLLLHCLHVCMVPNEKCHPYLCSSNITFFFLQLLFGIFLFATGFELWYMLWCRFLVLGVHLAFGICGFIVFIQLGKFLAIITSSTFSVPSSPLLWGLQLPIY